MPLPMRFPRFPEPLHRPRARSRAATLTAITTLALLLAPFGAPTTLAQPKPPPTAAGPKPAPTTRPRAASTSTAPRPAGPLPARPRPAPSASASASAAVPPAPADPADQAGQLYVEGFAAFERGDFPEAESILTKAWALSRSFDVAGALGSAKLELGKHREAAQYLSFAIRNALPSTRAAVRDRIKRDLDSAKTKLAAVKLNVSLLEAKIAIDGAPFDPIFLGPEIYVDPGKRTFEATADGYTPASSSIETKAGEIYVVTLKLERTSAPKGGGVVPPVPTEQSVPLPAAILGGLGGAAIIAGAVLIGAAEANKTNAYDRARNTLTPDGNPTCPRTGPGPTDQCDEVRSAAANADAFGNAGIGVFIGAGTLLAGATVYMLFIHSDPPPAAPPEGQRAPGPQSRLLPAIGPNGGGLIWQGSF